MLRRVSPAGGFVCCVVVVLVLLSSLAVGQSPVLEVRLIDTVAESGATGVPIPVYMNNYRDTVAGFSLWLVLSRPDIMSFQLRFDTSGTLASGWELVRVNQVGGLPSNIKVVAVANWPPAPTTPGIAPQQDGLPLIKLIADVGAIPDTATNRTVDILLSRSNLSDFAFSDPNGQVIGTTQDSVWDTAYFACTEWVDDTTCANWEQVYPWEPYDSLYEYWRYFAIIDTAQVIVQDGSLTISGGYVCGNIDGDIEGAVDISDLIYLSDYMFQYGPAPNPLAAADCNGDGGLDISDLIWLVEFMFLDGPAPQCAK